MKKLRNLIALFAVFSMAAVFTGCGDDDDDDDDNGGAPAGPAFAPATAAAFTGNTYTITYADGTTAQLTFPNAGTYSLTTGGQTETGTITGLTRNGEDYIATLTPANNTGTIRAGEMRVHFTQKTANTFAGTITTQGAAGAQTSNFTATVNSGSTTGSTTGTTTGSTTGTTTGSTTGTTTGSTTGTTTGSTTGTTTGSTTGGTATEPPASLTGRTLQLSYQPSGGERFDFTTDSSGTFENGQDNITYTWDRTNTRIQASRTSQTGAAVGNYDIDLTFNQGSGNAGSATVIFTQPGGTPQTDQATFTLTP